MFELITMAGIFVVNIPVIALCIASMSIYSNGNLQFISSLDCVFVNLIVGALSLVEVLRIERQDKVFNKNEDTLNQT